MSLSALESTVNTAFDARDGISTTKGEVREAVDTRSDCSTRAKRASPSAGLTGGRSISG
jgi:hypothetical protein